MHSPQAGFQTERASSAAWCLPYLWRHVYVTCVCDMCMCMCVYAWIDVWKYRWMNEYAHTLQYITLHCLALHYIALHYTTLYTVHYMHYIHYITFIYVTLRCHTIHYIRTYLFTALLAYIHTLLTYIPIYLSIHLIPSIYPIICEAKPVNRMVQLLGCQLPLSTGDNWFWCMAKAQVSRDSHWMWKH